MSFEWDEEKNFTNLIKHGMDFEDALSAFGDPFALEVIEEANTEIRYKKLCFHPDKGLLMIVLVEKENVTRIISARKATKRERISYAKNIRGI